MSKTETKQEQTREQFVIPAGFEDCSSDTVGTWDSRNEKCSPGLLFKPSEVVMIDNNVTPSRPSILVMGKAMQDTRVIKRGTEKDKEPTIVTAKRGDLVGVWYSPGMRGLEGNKDITTAIVFKEMVPMDNGRQPMRKYTVAREAGKKSSPLAIRGDFRKESRAYKTVFNGGTDDNEVEGAGTPF